MLTWSAWPEWERKQDYWAKYFSFCHVSDTLKSIKIALSAWPRWEQNLFCLEMTVKPLQALFDVESRGLQVDIGMFF